MTARLDTIRARHWSPKLGEIGEVVEGVDDVHQSIGVVLTTPKGSVPGRPSFGCAVGDYIDEPFGVATAEMIREAVEALRKCEPRAEDFTVTVDYGDQPDPAVRPEVRLTIAWRLKDDQVEQVTEVTL